MSLKVNATTSQLGVLILALLEMIRQIVLAAVMLAMFHITKSSSDSSHIAMQLGNIYHYCYASMDGWFVACLFIAFFLKSFCTIDPTCTCMQKHYLIFCLFFHS